MIEIDCHISVRNDGVRFLGATQTELIREIKQTGSLSGAAKKLKISYQHAWTMIAEMNRIAPQPIVSKQRGGANGGGACVSEYGERILLEYQIIEDQVKNLIRQINAEINF